MRTPDPKQPVAVEKSGPVAVRWRVSVLAAFSANAALEQSRKEDAIPYYAAIAAMKNKTIETRHHGSGTIASISTRNAGSAKPATTNSVFAGGSPLKNSRRT